jgi:predicted Zn-dependent protease
MLRWLDLMIQLRTGSGKPAEWRQSFESFKGTMTRSAGRLHLVSALTALGDAEALRDFLLHQPADALMEEFGLATSIKAWDAAGMKEEAEIARNKAREIIPSLVTSAWAEENTDDAFRAVRLALQVNGPELIPPPFIAAMQQAEGNPVERAHLRALNATLRSDWEAARSAAEEMVTSRPQNFSAKLLLGRALVKLSRPQDAVPHLKSYIDHCPDEVDILEARELLRETPKP